MCNIFYDNCQYFYVNWLSTLKLARHLLLGYKFSMIAFQKSATIINESVHLRRTTQG